MKAIEIKSSTNPITMQNNINSKSEEKDSYMTPNRLKKPVIPKKMLPTIIEICF